MTLHKEPFYIFLHFVYIFLAYNTVTLFDCKFTKYS